MAEGQETMSLPLRLWVRAGDLIFVSGHGAVNERGEFVGDTFQSQFEHTMNHLQSTLREAGAGLEDVVSVRCYVQDSANLPLYNQLYRRYFTEPFPARTTIVNCLPPGLEFEIECVALARDAQAEQLKETP